MWRSLTSPSLRSGMKERGANEEFNGLRLRWRLVGKGQKPRRGRHCFFFFPAAVAPEDEELLPSSVTSWDAVTVVGVYRRLVWGIQCKN